MKCDRLETVYFMQEAVLFIFSVVIVRRWFSLVQPLLKSIDSAKVELMADNNTSHESEPLYTEIAKLVPIAVAIVMTNVFVIVLFYKRRYLQTTTPNYPLLSLAVCDFITGFVNIPLFIITILTPVIRSPEARHYLSYLVFVFHSLTATAAVYHILVVIAEKYFAILWPLKHRLLSKKTMFKVITTVWLASFVIAFIPFSWINISKGPFRTKLFLGHGIFCLVTVFFSSYVFIVYALVTMFRKIFGKSEQKTPSLLRRNIHTNHRVRVCVIFAVMASVFAVCWLPWFILSLLVNLQVRLENLENFMQWFVPFRYLTSVINPLLYTFFKPDFRRAFKGLLCNKLMCRKGHPLTPRFSMAWRRSSFRGENKRQTSRSVSITALPLVKRESTISTMETDYAGCVSSV